MKPNLISLFSKKKLTAAYTILLVLLFYMSFATAVFTPPSGSGPNNIELKIDGTYVLRTGTDIHLVTRMKNYNNDSVVLKNIRVFSEDGTLLKEVEVNEELRPLGLLIHQLNQLSEQYYSSSTEYVDAVRPVLEEMYSSNSVRKTRLKISVYDLNPRPQIGDNMTMTISAELKQDGVEFTLDYTHRVRIRPISCISSDPLRPGMKWSGDYTPSRQPCPTTTTTTRPTTTTTEPAVTTTTILKVRNLRTKPRCPTGVCSMPPVRETRHCSSIHLRKCPQISCTGAECDMSIELECWTYYYNRSTRELINRTLTYRHPEYEKYAPCRRPNARKNVRMGRCADGVCPKPSVRMVKHCEFMLPGEACPPIPCIGVECNTSIRLECGTYYYNLTTGEFINYTRVYRHPNYDEYFCPEQTTDERKQEKKEKDDEDYNTERKPKKQTTTTTSTTTTTTSTTPTTNPSTTTTTSTSTTSTTHYTTTSTTINTQTVKAEAKGFIEKVAEVIRGWFSKIL